MGMMTSIAAGTLLGAAGTGLGGAICYAMPGMKRAMQSGIMMFSGGVMTGMVLLSMLPEAFSGPTPGPGMLGLLFSGLFVWLLSLTLRSPRAARAEDISVRLHRTSLMVISAIAMHNLPEGLAIGTGMSVASDYTVTLILLMLLHDIPEGMAAGVGFRAGELSAWKGIGACVAVGLPTGLGAAAGYWIGEISETFMEGSIAFAGGAMLLITALELLPVACALDGRLRVMVPAFAAGLALALTVIVAV